MYQISAQIGEDFAWAPISLQQGLGIPDRLGFTQTQAPAHCSFPTFVHGPEVQAFINTFLLNKTSAKTRRVGARLLVPIPSVSMTSV